MTRTILVLSLMTVIPVFAQSPPASPDHLWHFAAERQIVSEGNRFRQSAFRIEPDKTYSLTELIDLAEAHNPETRLVEKCARGGCGPRNRA
jgi:outer membrane protein